MYFDFWEKWENRKFHFFQKKSTTSYWEIQKCRKKCRKNHENFPSKSHVSFSIAPLTFFLNFSLTQTSVSSVFLLNFFKKIIKKIPSFFDYFSGNPPRKRRIIGTFFSRKNRCFRKALFPENLLLVRKFTASKKTEIFSFSRFPGIFDIFPA